MINKLKYFLLGHFIFRAQINIEKEWFGNSYGGFYISSNGLNENSIIYSVGIGEDISFDLDIISKFNCKIFAFDPTPKSISWVKDNVIVSKKNFIFHEFGISAKSGFFDFYLPKNPNHVSGSIVKNSNIDILNSIQLEFRTISQVIEELEHNRSIPLSRKFLSIIPIQLQTNYRAYCIRSSNLNLTAAFTPWIGL